MKNKIYENRTTKVIGTSWGCVIKFIDWSFFLILCFVSLGLTWGVLEQYQSKSTSFKVYERSIEEHPTITFCFSKWRKNGTAYDVHLEYNKHFKIQTNHGKGRKIDLKLGINEKEGIRIEMVKLITTYSGTCYKITTNLNDTTIPGEYYGLKIFFFKEFLTYGSIPPTKVYITSEKNAFGITANDWRDGKVLEYSLMPCTKTMIAIKPIQYIYRKTNKCRYASFYQCFEEYIFKNPYDGCEVKCSAGKEIGPSYICSNPQLSNRSKFLQQPHH